LGLNPIFVVNIHFNIVKLKFFICYLSIFNLNFLRGKGKKKKNGIFFKKFNSFFSKNNNNTHQLS